METIRQQILNYKPYNEQEVADQRVALQFMNQFPDCFTRENEFGHFTSSAWIVNKERTKVLMIFHNIYQSWSWTGGHADGDVDLLHVAIKEAKEETGLEEIKAVTNDIYSLENLCVDGHVKRGAFVPSHIHYNVTYLLEADDTKPLIVKEDENSGVKWVLIDEAVALCREEYMKTIYQKLNEKLM